MTLALDASALLARHLIGPARYAVDAACDADADWCASALALAEALALVGPATTTPGERAALERALRRDWDRVVVVPVDTACLDRAAELAAEQPLRLVDAIHLAAALRLPAPVRFVTFDPRQIPVALSLGFDVVST